MRLLPGGREGGLGACAIFGAAEVPLADAEGDPDGKGCGSAALSEHPDSTRLSITAATAGLIVVRLRATVAPLDPRREPTRKSRPRSRGNLSGFEVLMPAPPLVCG
jgi:hypothetical protein